MGRRTAAARAERQSRGIVFYICREAFQRIGRKVLRHNQYERLLRNEHDRREVIDRIVERLLVEALIVSLGADSAEENLVTVRIGQRHALGADHAARSPDIFYNDM